MPRVEIGNMGAFDFPDEMTDQEINDDIQNNLAPTFDFKNPDPEQVRAYPHLFPDIDRGSVFGGLGSGFERLGRAPEAVGAAVGRSQEELDDLKAQMAEDREKQRYRASLDDVASAWDKGSYLEAAGTLFGDVLPQTLGESLPDMGIIGAGAYAGAKYGLTASAAVPLPGARVVGTVGGAIIGGAFAGLPTFFGMNVERQIEANNITDPNEIKALKAGGAAIAQGALEGLIYPVLGWLPGVKGMAAKSVSDLMRVGTRKLMAPEMIGVVTKKALAGGLTEAVTEVGQQALERAQAGLELNDAEGEALKEYTHAAILGGLLGKGFGAIGGAYSNLATNRSIKQIEQLARLEAGDRAWRLRQQDVLAEQFETVANADGNYDVLRHMPKETPETIDQPPLVPNEDGEFVERDATEGEVEDILVQEGKEEARSDFDKYGVRTAVAEEKAQNIRNNMGEEAAVAYEDEYQRLIDAAVAQRQGKEAAPAPTSEVVSTHATEIEANMFVNRYSKSPIGTPLEELQERDVTHEDYAEYQTRTTAGGMYVNKEMQGRIQEALRDPGERRKVADAGFGMQVVDSIDAHFERTGREAVATTGAKEGATLDEEKLILLAIDAGIENATANFAGAKYLPEAMRETALTKYLGGVLSHEHVHALRSIGKDKTNEGAFTTTDWGRLKKYATDHRRADTGRTNLEQVTETHSDQFKGLTPEKREDALMEEAIAETFREWALDPKNVTGKPASLFRKTVKLIGGLGSMFRKAGARSANDVFRSIEAGTMKVDGAVTTTGEPKFAVTGKKAGDFTSSIVLPTGEVATNPIFNSVYKDIPLTPMPPEIIAANERLNRTTERLQQFLSGSGDTVRNYNPQQQAAVTRAEQAVSAAIAAAYPNLSSASNINIYAALQSDVAGFPMVDGAVAATGDPKFSVSNAEFLAQQKQEERDNASKRYAADIRRPGKSTITRHFFAQNDIEARRLAAASPALNRGASEVTNIRMDDPTLDEDLDAPKFSIRRHRRDMTPKEYEEATTIVPKQERILPHMPENTRGVAWINGEALPIVLYRGTDSGPDAFGFDHIMAGVKRFGTKRDMALALNDMLTDSAKEDSPYIRIKPYTRPNAKFPHKADHRMSWLDKDTKKVYFLGLEKHKHLDGNTYAAITTFVPQGDADASLRASDADIAAYRQGRKKFAIAPTPDAMGFHSVAVNAAENFKEDSGTGKMWRKHLWDNSKKEELATIVGLEEMLKSVDGRISKGDMVAFLKQNGLQLGEVVLGGDKVEAAQRELENIIINQKVNVRLLDDLENQIEDAKDQGDTETGTNLIDMRYDLETQQVTNQREADRLRSDIDEGDYGGQTVFSGKGYEIPGGTNQREFFITLPSGSPTNDSIKNWLNPAGHRIGIGEADQKMVVRIRVNDRLVNGKRVLFIEEIQADRQQAARDLGGFPPTVEEITALYNEREAILAERRVGVVTDDIIERQRDVEARGEILDKRRAEAPPPIPWATDSEWGRLALKRVIYRAVTEGYDSIAWTPGQVQLDRYPGLEQTITDARLEATGPEGAMYLETFNTRGRVGYTQLQSSGMDRAGLQKEISKLTNEETAKTITTPLQMSRILAGIDAKATGLDIKVGGKGMKTFYDRDLQNIIKKDFKKFKATVDTINLSGVPEISGGKLTLEQFARTEGFPDFAPGTEIQEVEDRILQEYEDYFQGADAAASQDVWNFDIPPAMAEVVKKEGLSKFSIAPDIDSGVKYSVGDTVGTYYHSTTRAIEDILEWKSNPGMTPDDFMLHLGTKQAAVERVEAKRFTEHAIGGPRQVDRHKDKERLYKINVTPKKPLGSPQDPLHEGEEYAVTQFASFLRERGDYDAVFYQNNVEDPGSISIAVIDPNIIEVIDEHIGAVDETGPQFSIAPKPSQVDMRIRQGVFENEARVRAEREGITLEEALAKQEAEEEAGELKFSIAPPVDSAAFQDWFAGSMLVDANGDPLLLYHGTRDTMAQFDFDHPNRWDTGWLGTGVYVTTDAKLAGEYTRIKGGRADPNIIPLFGNLQNPHYATIEEKQRIMLISHNEGKEAGRAAADARTKELQALGHDGIILTWPKDYTDGEMQSEIVIFDPGQVKSPFNQDFDRNDPKFSIARAQDYLRNNADELGLSPELLTRINPIYQPGVLPAERMPTNQEGARWLERRFDGEAIEDLTAVFTPEQIEEIATMMAAEVQLGLQNSGNAFDWYSGALDRALDVISVDYPMLTDDAAAADAGFGTAANSRFVFTYIMAVTSQNLDVSANSVATDNAFKAMLPRVKAGNYNMLGSWATGDKQEAMAKNFNKFGPILKAMPGATFADKLTGMDELFRQSRTVKEWVALMKEKGIPYTAPSQTAVDAVVYGSSLLGPKIGNGFWQNLNGNYSPLTIDLWMRRTWGRLTGKSIGNPDALPGQRDRFKRAIIRSRSQKQGVEDHVEAARAEVRLIEGYLKQTSLSEFPTKKAFNEETRQLKADLKEAQEVAADLRGVKAPKPWRPEYNTDQDALLAYAKEALSTWNQEYSRLKETSNLKEVPAELQPTWARAAKTIITNLAKPLDQVANGTQRKQIEAAGAMALEILATRGVNMTMADMQAVLWYPEKELWGALTTELAVDEDGVPVVTTSSLNESYDTAFTRILEKRNEVKGTRGDRSRGTGSGAVAGQDARPQGPESAEGIGGTGEGLSGRGEKFSVANLAELGPVTVQERSIWQKLKREVKKQLAPGGLLHEIAYALKTTRDGFFNDQSSVVEWTLTNFARAVKNTYGKYTQQLSPEQLAEVNDMLHGGPIPPRMSGEMRTAVLRMRQDIDNMSGEYLKIIRADIAELRAEGNEDAALRAEMLKKIFVKNLGRYVTRSYQVFDDPAWHTKIPVDVQQAALRYLTDQYGGDREKANHVYTVLTRGEGTAFNSMEALIKESTLGAKDLSILMRRNEDLAPEIRALLGENKDPQLNYARSMLKMSRLIGNTHFLNELKLRGKGLFLFDEKDGPIPPTATLRIAGEKSNVMSPLNGLWAHPDTVQAFDDILNKSNVTGLVGKLIGIKWGKVVMSSATQIRNFVSNISNLLATGSFHPEAVPVAWDTMRSYMLTLDGGAREYYRMLVDKNVMLDTPNAGQLQDLMDNGGNDILEALEVFFKKNLGERVDVPIEKLRTFKKIIDKLYRAGDEFWKIIGFESQLADIMKARNQTREQAVDEAASRVRRTMFTYSQTGAGMKWLGRWPVVGPFVSFASESVRSTIEGVKIVREDHADPQMRHLARRRAVGLALAHSWMFGLAAVSRAMYGVDDEEMEALRSLGSPWAENANLMVVGREKDGSLITLDLSYLDMFNIWHRPITAIMRDQPIEEGLIDAVKETLKPFFGPDIAIQNISEMALNQKLSGGRVFNPDAPAEDILGDLGDHIYKGLFPGVAQNIRRVLKAVDGERTPSGKVYDLKTELMATAGFRTSIFDPKLALNFRVNDFKEELSNATSYLYSVAGDVNPRDEDELFSAFENANKMRKRAYDNFAKLVNSARNSGLSDRDIRQVLRAANVPKKYANALARGREVPKWKLATSFLRGNIKRAKILLGREVAKDLQVRRRAVRQISRSSQ